MELAGARAESEIRSRGPCPLRSYSFACTGGASACATRAASLVRTGAPCRGLDSRHPATPPKSLMSPGRWPFGKNEEARRSSWPLAPRSPAVSLSRFFARTWPPHSHHLGFSLLVWFTLLVWFMPPFMPAARTTCQLLFHVEEKTYRCQLDTCYWCRRELYLVPGCRFPGCRKQVSTDLTWVAVKFSQLDPKRTMRSMKSSRTVSSRPSHADHDHRMLIQCRT